MIRLRIYIFITGIWLPGCYHQSDLDSSSEQVERYVDQMPDVEPISHPVIDDTVVFNEMSVVFFAPSAEELRTLPDDQYGREGLMHAVGDFAYYARLVSDSLESANITVHFTDRRYLHFSGNSVVHKIDRLQSGSPIGLILFDGEETPVVIPGMQTHLSLLATISEHFINNPQEQFPLLNYFEETATDRLHIYSSHSDILNQTGNRIDPAYYDKLGASIAARAAKYHMSVFAYQKFPLKDSLQAIICRVPSRYDESAVRLFIWDQQVGMVKDEIELAENVWNEQWIMVKDSWISIEEGTGNFSIVQRKKEARMKDGSRTETDDLYRWDWHGSGFHQVPVSGLSVKDFPLRDWESYQEPKAPDEITIVDENYVWLPLKEGDLTWENLIMLIPKPYTIEKEPIENQLVANRIDTLVTISRPGVKLKFYRSPQENLMVDGVISDHSIPFRNELKIGMPKADFVQSFNKLSGVPVVPNLVKVCSKNQDRVISYVFQNDSLARIEVLNFIH